MRGPIEISKYTYHLFSSRDEAEATIFLYDRDSNVVGEIVFVDDAEALPEAQQRERRYWLYFRRRDLGRVVDMLRNEGPVYLVWRDGRNTTLSTEYEAIGEGEALTKRFATR